MIIRKHISILLALFILVINSSATLVFHSCHDEIAYVSINYQDASLATSADENSCCSPIKDENAPDGCCSNQEIKVGKKVDYSLANQLKIVFEAVGSISTKIYSNPQQTLATTIQENVHYTFDSHAPPFYKLYSQFVFYA